jgi:glycosyltransferase involved in cell wall biosynthesis
MYRKLFKNNFAICLSPELTNDIAPYTTNTFIVPNGIKRLNGISGTEKRKRSSYHIAYLSNLIRSKGVLELIEALGTVKRNGASFSLSIIGKAGDVSESEVHERLENLGLRAHVEHFGPLYDDAKYHELLSSDLLVFPTRYKNEASPLVIIEAMQCGLPVISTREGGIPSLIDEGRTGFLVDGTTAELATKIQYLINHPEQNRSMGLAGKQKYNDHHTLEIFEQNLVNTLKTILKQTAENQ